MNFRVEKENWILYADSVGDFNKIHREKKYAKERGLNDIIVPGLFIASHFQHIIENENLTFNEIKIIFRDYVFDKEEVEMKKEKKFYKVYTSNKFCVQLTPKYENCIKEPRVVDKQDSIEWIIEEEKVGNFLKSISLGKLNKLPEMYLMSLSAGALLNYAAKKKLTGIHRSQSIEFYQTYNFGELKIFLEEEKTKGEIMQLNLNWIQDDRLIASGESVIIPLKI
ncbi:MAG: MaoC/PaaZ C-terminal domain-containing protein [Nanoarchaeota archaeon]